VRAAALALLALAACARVPEASLRDEQARSRRYRDAYETALAENAGLKKRLAALREECEEEQPR